MFSDIYNYICDIISCIDAEKLHSFFGNNVNIIIFIVFVILVIKILKSIFLYLIIAMCICYYFYKNDDISKNITEFVKNISNNKKNNNKNLT
jgi:chromate transport protein ChrA